MDEVKTSCRYRGEGGTKCAIGLHIPDDVYCPEMESRNAYYILTQFPAVLFILESTYGEITNEDIHFIDAVQAEVHDRRALKDYLIPTLEEAKNLLTGYL